MERRRLRRGYITPVVYPGCQLFYGRLSGSEHNDLICLGVVGRTRSRLADTVVGDSHAQLSLGGQRFKPRRVGCLKKVTVLGH